MKFIERMMKNPQTTVSGITSILAGCATIGGMVKGSAQATPENISIAGGLIATGLGLVFASDSKRTEKE